MCPQSRRWPLATAALILQCQGSVAASAHSTQDPASPTSGAAQSEKGKLREDLKAFDRAVAENPAGAKAYRERAQCRRLLEDFRGALLDYNKAIELDPRSATAWNGRALAKWAMKDFDGALADVEQALALDPNSANAHNTRGITLKDRGDLAGAVKEYEKAIELDPKQRPAHNNLGQAQEKLGDLSGALASYNRAVEIDPRHANSIANRGAVKARMGDRAAARADLQAALAIEPGHKFALAQLNKLEAGSTTVAKSATVVDPKAQSSTGTTQSSTSLSVPTNATREAITLPTVKFEASDPCKAAALAPNGLPWQTPKPGSAPPPPPGIPATTLAPFLDFKRMTQVQYNGAVSVAAEGMRLLYGDISPEAEQRFRSVWTPLFGHPTQAAVDYLDRLNPPLGQFLAGREAFLRAAAAAQTAMFDASLAVATGKRDAYIDALAILDRQDGVMRSLQGGLIQLAARIQALGNPPDPLAAACEAQKRYRRAFIGKTSLDGEWVTDGGDRLYFKTIRSYPDHRSLVYQYSFAFGEKLQKSGLDASESGLQSGKDGTFFAFGMDDTLLLVEEQPDGMLLATPATALGPALIAFFPQGERIRQVLYKHNPFDNIWVFSGTTQYRSPSTLSKPPVLPGHTWERLLAVASDNEQGRIRNLIGSKKAYAPQLAKLVSVDPDNLPVPPKIRRAWDENPYKKGDPRHDQWARGEEPDAPKPAPTPVVPKPVVNAADPEGVRETIAFHRSMIALLNRNLEKELADLGREPNDKRRAQLAFRALQLKSDAQAEEDLITSYETGTLVHTRSAFDEFAQGQFVEKIRTEAARVDATRTVAIEVERRIELLPPELRRSMRLKSRQILDGATVAGGDLEKALKVAGTLDGMIQGYWQGEEARKEEKAIDEAESKFLVNIGIMATGTVVIGLSTAALANSFGETATITLWGPHIIGGIYGGTAGLITGGPVEGISQAAAMSSPLGAAVVDFARGFTEATFGKKAGWEEGLWAGATSAGTSFLMGKAIQLGSGLVNYGALSFFGKESRLFRPMFGPRPTVKQVFAAAKFQQDVEDAQSLVALFKEKQVSHAKLQTKVPAGSPELAEAERELKRLAASLNSSYHCKWLLKYDAHPSVRRGFSRWVEQSYDEAIPEMYKILKDQGYDISNLKFKPIRNASSAGTSSMDLDLALEEPPGFSIMRDGKPVEMGELQRDGQRALNQAYHAKTGFSASRSEVNLTTSVHGESFSSKALLKKNVNFNALKPEDVESVGRVLDTKAKKIEGDPVLGEIAKMQAKCREGSKEIENLLLKQLKQKLAAVAPGSPAAQQLEIDINYWTDILTTFKTVGTRTTDPYEILRLDRALRSMTGGRGCGEVGHDVSGAFTGK